MTLPIHWSQQARADLLQIVRYIGERVDVLGVLHSRQRYPLDDQVR